MRVEVGVDAMLVGVVPLADFSRAAEEVSLKGGSCLPGATAEIAIPHSIDDLHSIRTMDKLKQ